MPTEAQINNLKHWKYLVECKDTMSWPKNGNSYVTLQPIKYSKKFRLQEGEYDKTLAKMKERNPDRYDNFEYFVEQFVGHILNGSDTAMEYMKDEAEAFNSLEYDTGSLSPNYWSYLSRIPKGEQAAPQVIPPLDATDNESKQKVYDAFMPAYRAIRERFEKRSFLQWIFNHKEYVTERNTMKNLRSLMQALTQDSKADIDAKYREYKQDVVLTKQDEKEILAQVKQDKERFKAERQREQDELNRFEQKEDDWISVASSDLEDETERTQLSILEEEEKPELHIEVEDVKDVPQKNIDKSLNI